jgi:DNA-binding SARP family transcriptional activator
LRQLRENNPSDRRLVEITERIRSLPDVVRELIGGLEPTAVPHIPSLRFIGFGPGQVEKEGELLPGSAWRSALARHILFYLLVHPRQSRDQIESTFWPDLSPEKAKATFHVVKHQAHRALGRALISFRDGFYTIELDPDCWFDVTAFEALLAGQDHRQARLEEAVTLYQGDFLEDYDAEWCLLLRERLRLRYRDGLLELGGIYTAQHQLDRALEVLGSALSIDDLHEPTCRALMRLHAKGGSARAALEQFEQLKRRLQEELETTPSPETVTLSQAIQSRDLTT